MRILPINHLSFCTFKGCKHRSDVLVERLIGDKVMVFGYCQFHSIIGATFFSTKHRVEIKV